MWLGFRPLRSVYAATVLPIIPHIIANTKTIYEGSALEISTNVGVDILGAVDEDIFGYCVGFAVKNIPIELVSSNSSYIDGTVTVAPTGTSYLSAGDNLTDKMVQALVVPSNGIVCSGLLDATAATTTGSNLVGYSLSILTSDSRYLAESTSSTTAGQFILTSSELGNQFATDPQDASGNRVLVIGAENQLERGTA
jgi:hypothetical protein